MTPQIVCWLILFAAACLAPILNGLRQRSGVLQFPFLAGCGLLGFLFPQAVAVARNGTLAPPEGVAKALLMCTLTALAVWLGWREPVPSRWAAQRPQACPVNRLYWIGLLFMTVGLVGFLKLTSLSGGVLEHYSTQGNYALTWKGMPVVYDFFELYLTPGFALCGLAAFSLRSKVRLLPLAVTLAVQLAAIVFLGRRSALVAVLLQVGCLLYFGKRWLPPRRIVLCAAPLVALAMFLGPAYRRHSQIDSGRDSLLELDAARVLGTVAEGTGSEFWAAANIIQATSEDRRYGFGAGVYDTLILLFVPKLVVGEDLKAALLTGQRDRAASGWQMPYGMVPTGPGSAFCEFWYFGCLWFFALSRLMRYLWVRASAGGDIGLQAVYMCLLTPAVGSVVMDMHGIYPPVFMFWAPLAVLAALTAPCRLPRPRRTLDLNPEEHYAVSR
jgi:hypothetical protein